MRWRRIASTAARGRWPPGARGGRWFDSIASRAFLRARGAQVRTQPRGELLGREMAAGEGEHLRIEGVILDFESRPVEFDEGFTGNRSGALVAIDEGMIARQTMGQRRGEVGEIRFGFRIGVHLLRFG